MNTVTVEIEKHVPKEVGDPIAKAFGGFFEKAESLKEEEDRAKAIAEAEAAEEKKREDLEKAGDKAKLKDYYSKVCSVFPPKVSSVKAKKILLRFDAAIDTLDLGIGQL